MTTIPLLSDQHEEDVIDLERGLLSYEQAQAGAGEAKPSPATSSSKAPASLFNRHFGAINESNAVAFAQLHIRLTFLRKVLGILAFQFASTLVLCTFLYLTPSVKGFIQHQPWVVFASMFASIALLVAMFIHSHNTPYNYFLLGGWTILQACTIGAVVSFYDAEVVIQAVLLTCVVVASLFFYTLQSKRDFQKHYAALFSISIVFLMATMIQIILMSSTFNFLVSIAGAAIFSLYLIFDIDAIMNHYSEEDYIIACISIYMDIMGLFLRILQILNELNRN